MTLITRRAALRGIASIPAIGGATAAFAGSGVPVPPGACVAAAPADALPVEFDLDSMPISALWPRAIELAHDLSEILDRLTQEGDLMVEVHAGKSGHPRVGFRDALPNDARGMLAYYAACYRQTAQAIEPDVTEWSHVIYADADVDSRFALIGNRKTVQS